MRHLKKIICWIAILVTLTVCGGCSVFSPHTVPNVLQTSLMQARALVRQSNIAIDTKYMSSTGWFGRTEGESLGSGVIYDEDDNYYYALTNSHVVTDTVDGRVYTTSYTITDINGYTHSGEVVAEDEEKDIAIIRFRKRSYSVLRMIDYKKRLDSNVVKGELVLAVGNPSGVKNIVTYGEVVSYANIANVTYDVIYHTALINSGNSGGALCDLDGNLLGINTWGSKDRDDENFAIPLTVINAFIAQYEQSQQAVAPAA